MTILLEIPLQPIPNQQVGCTLNGQQTTFDIYIAGTTVYVNVYLNSAMIIAGMPAVNAAYLTQYPTAFSGYLFFYDDTGVDPTYQSLGITSHLLFSDYDALALDYAAWIIANIPAPAPFPPIGVVPLFALQSPQGLSYIGINPDDPTQVLGVLY